MVRDYRLDLLGGRQQATRMPILGSLRPGIKRLKKGCSDQDQAIYDAMVAAGALWTEIEDKLGPDKEGKTKLVPENRDYFTVRPGDCRTYPENAEILHKLYADPDGKIRRIPIVFLFGDWYETMPHQLMCWTARELKYRSEYKEH